jgi:hypothetical protein
VDAIEEGSRVERLVLQPQELDGSTSTDASPQDR